VALASRGGNGSPRASTTPTPTARATRTATPAKTAKAKPTATATATDTPAATATPTATASAGAPSLATARKLQLAGYNARLAGDYGTALQQARAALQACGSAHQLDPCGYALFEEGAALNRSGDPAAAIPVLQDRLSSYGDDASRAVTKELRDATARASGKKPKKNGRGKGD
jgi:hypothetical protein